MYYFNEKSRQKLETVHPKIQKIVNEVIKIYDFSIIWGYRGKELQDKFYNMGTGLKWPTSKHNTEPSLAVDVAPYPIDWQNEKEFVILAGLILAEAKKQGIDLVWGGLWLRRDLGHFQLSNVESAKKNEDVNE